MFLCVFASDWSGYPASRPTFPSLAQSLRRLFGKTVVPKSESNGSNENTNRKEDTMARKLSQSAAHLRNTAGTTGSTLGELSGMKRTKQLLRRAHKSTLLIATETQKKRENRPK